MKFYPLGRYARLDAKGNTAALPLMYEDPLSFAYGSFRLGVAFREAPRTPTDSTIAPSIHDT